jgi:hypothetical protein
MARVSQTLFDNSMKWAAEQTGQEIEFQQHNGRGYGLLRARFPGHAWNTIAGSSGDGVNKREALFALNAFVFGFTAGLMHETERQS